jgi:WD40 repeat protein
VGNDDKLYFGTQSGKIHVDDVILDGHKSEITAMAHSPNGAFLASGDSTRKIILWNTTDNTVIFDNWVYHSARVTSMDWSPSGDRLVSGSLDCNIIVWGVDGTRKIETGAHRGQTRSVKYISDTAIASSGGENLVKIWQLQ